MRKRNTAAVEISTEGGVRRDRVRDEAGCEPLQQFEADGADHERDEEDDQRADHEERGEELTAQKASVGCP